ncbi:MAG: hypothetical protein PHI37_04425 [Candidatus Gracilibacteria bacterium]|nr:hypothetical protein [Candidatus Gracilibacteria bacterium]
MKNKKIFFIFIFVLIIFLVFLGFNTYEKNKQKKIYESKLVSYNEEINDYLSSYKQEDGFYITNLKKEFIYIPDINQIKWMPNIPTLSDFDIEHNKDLKNYSESKIDFLFANNKMTFLVNDLLLSDNQDIYKYIFVNYLEAYFKNNNLKIAPFLTGKTDYQNLVSKEKEIFELSFLASEEYIDKYFLLSYLGKSGVDIDNEFLNLLKQDIEDNFNGFDNYSKLLYIFFLNELGELDDFLSSRGNISDLLSSFGNNLNVKSFETYILSLKEKDNEDIQKNIEELESSFDNLDNTSKILLVGILNNLGKDFSKYYDEIEKIEHNDYQLKELFIKFLVYSKLNTEYTSFDNYAKFWFSSGMQVNRKEEFIVSRETPYYFESYRLDKVIYEDLIDNRVGAFDGKKFYLNIILKQK